ncbi:DUF2336 domain-containing protein [Methylopila henanensis]|uniref:DUF2336 domain-containing protein n=1 Tax=Methylopila henanensis TaxID=873516 RepID=A0ABW4KB56_9HYPH
MTDELLPVEALERLSRQDGVDVRPILLRVLTDLFIQKPHHAPEELVRYEELALQLLDVVGVETRAVVARKLAGDPHAPQAVIARLLKDDVSVAGPILARSDKVSRHHLLTIALDGGVVEASAVAQRADIDADMARILAHHRDERVVETLIANPALQPTPQTLATLVRRAHSAPVLAAAMLRRSDFDPAALSPLYLAAGPEQRGQIREAIAARPGRAARAGRMTDQADAAMVEAAVASGDHALMAEALSVALGVSLNAAATLAAEPSGEAFVFMLRGLGVERDQIARALLLAQPEIARSVNRFFDLVELAETTPRGVALELVGALAGLQAPSQTAKHEPLFDPSGAPERAGAARSAARVRRAPTRTSEPNRGRG